MKYTEHTFEGVTRRLSFTAGALFKIYEKYGYTSSIVSTLELDKGTEKGWNNTCWLYVLFAQQGAAQLRSLYLDAPPLITYDQLRTQASPADMAEIRKAVFDALELGFLRDRKPTEEEEQDMVLLELEERKKKETAGRISALLTSLRARLASTSSPEPPSS